MTWRWSSGAVVGFVALFWLGDLVAARLQPGYEWRRDYVSALAGLGARHAWVGVGAIAASGLAHGAAALCLRQLVPSARLAPALLALACLAMLVVAAARISCPAGAAGCHLPGEEAARSLGDEVHRAAVVTYEVCFVLAALAAVVLLLRAGRPWLAAAALLAAVLSPYLALTLDPLAPGGRERLWLAAGQAWLLVLGGAPIWSRQP